MTRAAAACGMELRLVPAPPAAAGCRHTLLSIVERTGDVYCADCAAVMRWPQGRYCAAPRPCTCTWPRCIEGGCAGPLGDGTPPVWELPDAG